MKNNGILLLIISVLFFSCKEKEPDIIFDSINTERVVLVEEFTGVQCVTCPAGSAELENLLSIYGENLVVVSLHAGGQSGPYPQSQYDFRTSEGDDIMNYLGTPAFNPSAVINRKDFDGGFYLLQYDKAKWNGFINEELQEAAKISVNISNTFNLQTRELKVQVSGFAMQDLEGDLRLTIMIKENNIVDAQLTPDSSDPILDYNHKHVFRTTLTDYAGDSFASEMSEGDSYEKTYTTVLPEEWKSSECEVVAFVSLVRENTDKEILQAGQSSVEN